jgi:hypothetical protein
MNKESAYIKEVIGSAKQLPDRIQHFGLCKVAWWEGKPGDAVVMAVDGSIEDRVLAEKVVANQLEGFGYKRATFYFADVDPTDILDREREQVDQGFAEQDDNLNAQQRERIIERQDNWNDLVDKAKRIVNSGGVTVINSTSEFVVGTVVGDHGNYECQISRQDPQAPVITGWHCTCKWNQFAWQRTRQWKIYEGRPCSHILALYYVDKQLSTAEEKEFVSTPPDLEGPPATPAPTGEPSPFAAPMGEAFPGGVVPSVPEGPRGLQQLSPFKPEDVGAMDPNEILEQRLGPLAPERTTFEPEDLEDENINLTPEEARYLGRPEKIQRPPLEILKERQRQEQQYTKPGESPYGAPAPPGTVSVPGARVPNERNPFGSIWSNAYNGHKLATAPGWYTYKPGDSITVSEFVIGLTEGPSNAKGVGEYQEIPAGSTGEVAGQDKTTGFIDAIFPLEGGAKTPTHVRCFLSPDEIIPPATNEEKTRRRGPDKDRPFGS